MEIIYRVRGIGCINVSALVMFKCMCVYVMYKNNGRWTYRVFLDGLGKARTNNYFWICSATGIWSASVGRSILIDSPRELMFARQATDEETSSCPGERGTFVEEGQQKAIASPPASHTITANKIAVTAF